MKIIEIYEFVFVIPKRNPAYVQEKLEKNKRNFRAGKALCLASEYTYQKHGQLREILASTLELLSYSDTARTLLQQEKWYAEHKLGRGNRITDAIINMPAKMTHEFDVSSKPLNFLMLMFLSYNALYTRSAKNSKYNYTSMIVDFRKIMELNEAGQMVKETTVEQTVDQMVADYCLQCIFLSTVNKIREIVKQNIGDFKDVVKFMEECLHFYHEDFLGSTLLVASGDTETDLDVINDVTSSDSGTTAIRYREFNSLLKVLQDDEDLKIMDKVIDELFTLTPGETFRNKTEHEMQLIALVPEECAMAVESKIKNETEPRFLMFQQVDDAERKTIHMIHQKLGM